MPTPFSQLKPWQIRALVFALLIAAIITAGQFTYTQAGNLSNVSVTLSNSRLSYRGELASGSGSESIIQIDADTSLNEYVGEGGDSDKETDQLKVGDTLVFPNDGNRTVQEIIDDASDDKVRIDSALSTDNTAGSTFYMAEGSDLEITFTTSSSVTGDNTFGGGYFRVLVPAAATDHSDDKPDQGYFDFTTNTKNITCALDSGSGHSFGSGTNESLAAQSVHGSTYHLYRCNYSGQGTGETISFDVSASTGTALINPAPGTDHDTGSADTYSIIVEHVDGNGTAADDSDDSVVDATTVKVGSVEAVRVSATVLPTLEFIIAGVSSGDSSGICGWDGTSDDASIKQTDVTTTANTVPFGEISIAAFTRAAQTLTVSTNAANGYAVTAVASDQLKHSDKVAAGTDCTGDARNDSGSGDFDSQCIEDSRGDNSGMGHDTDSAATSKDEWSSVTDSAVDTKGFAYSLHDASSTGVTLPFTYADSDNDCSGTFCAMQFADAEDSQTAETIMSNTTVVDGDSAYACYMLAASSLVAAGEYSSYITYTATATF